MRYAKGSVVISADRDIPLLRHVRNSRFISHEQLFELLRCNAAVPCRSTFNWRIHRLLTAGHIECLPGFCSQGSPVYSITSNGLLELESRGEFAIAFHSRTRRMPDRRQIFHALELNSIRLALLRNAMLIEWRSELEITSTNMISGSPYQKDYDAIVKVWVGDEVREFALEYERSLKSAKQYAKIRAALAAERLVPCVLYLTVSPDLLVALLYQLTPASKPLAFALAETFTKQLMATTVTTDMNHRMVTLYEFLQYAHPLYMGS